MRHKLDNGDHLPPAGADDTDMDMARRCLSFPLTIAPLTNNASALSISVCWFPLQEREDAWWVQCKFGVKILEMRLAAWLALPIRFACGGRACTC